MRPHPAFATLVGLSVLLVSACSSQPSAPSPSSRNLAISNLFAVARGTLDVACNLGLGVTYSAVDDLTFDIVASPLALGGAIVTTRSDSLTGTTNLPLQSCTLPSSPCDSNNSWCIEPGGANGRQTVRAHLLNSWQPTVKYQVSVRGVTGEASNELAVTVTHPEGFPTGNEAEILALDVYPCATALSQPGSRCYSASPGPNYGVNMSLYNPRIAGRTLWMALTIIDARGARPSTPATITETTPNNKGYGISRIVSTSADQITTPFQVIGTVRELQGDVVVSERTRTATSP